MLEAVHTFLAANWRKHFSIKIKLFLSLGHIRHKLKGLKCINGQVLKNSQPL